MNLATENPSKKTTQQPIPDQSMAARRLDFAESISSLNASTRLSVRVPDIRCAACSLTIERHLSDMPEVTRVATNLADKRVVVDFIAGDAIDFVDAIEGLGYTVLPDRLNLAQAALQQERKSMLARMGVAGIGMMQVMMYALAGYLTGASDLEPAYEGLMRWASLAVATPIALYSAMPFHQGALRDARNHHLGMDVPISLAILAAYGLSLVNTVLHTGAVYFDSVCMFAFLLLVGRYVELGSRQKYQLSQNLNDHVLPTAVQLFVEGETGPYVSVKVVPVGALIKVGAGDIIPVDGIVVSGQASVNEAAFTGESLPVSKVADRRVLAGSQLSDGELLIECTMAYEDFVLTRISALFRESSLYKPRFSVLADRIAGYFVGFILLVTIGSALFWLNAGSDQWVSIALAVLVVSCPCALSLATPVAYTVAISALRSAGVVIRNGGFLERLAAIDGIIFDKTGTLTTGALQLGAVELLTPSISRNQVVDIATALERGSLHPIAKAFGGGASLVAEDIKVSAGEGVSGRVEGQQYRLGKPSFAAGTPMSAPLAAGMWLLLAAETPLAWLQLIDEPRAEAANVVAKLLKQGYSVGLLSGDAAAEGRRIAGLLEITDITTDVTPDAKVADVRRRQALGARLLMVGDGINDAAAMVSAHTSIAVSPADVVVQEAADATLLTNSLNSLLTLINFSKQVRRIIRQNVAWAIAYNLCVIPLAVAGLLQPWMAALGMSLSSLLVVFNANRLKEVRD